VETKKLKEETDSTVNISVWKSETRIFTQREVTMGEKFTIAISNKIFVAAVPADSFQQGSQFEVG
jgi:hypothetical protein